MPNKQYFKGGLKGYGSAAKVIPEKCRGTLNCTPTFISIYIIKIYSKKSEKERLT
jgi:hypothetical protein